MKNEPLVNIDTAQPAARLPVVLVGMAAVIFAALAAIWVLPLIVPGMAASAAGTAPKIYWFLSRGTAVVGYILLWGSMASGIVITNRMARLWPGGPAAANLHEYLSLLGLGFSLFHALIITGDRYIQISIIQALIPFTAAPYRPVWVGLGQLGFYSYLIVTATFYVRGHIGTRTWRLIHYASYASFALALIHGIASGTDTGIAWTTVLYWISGATILFLTYYRIFVTVGAKNASTRTTQMSARPGQKAAPANKRGG